MHVVSLHVYPIKSTAPTDLASALVEPWGLTGDRRWLVTDPEGGQITARENRRLLLAQARDHGSGRLTVSAPDFADLELDGTALTADAAVEVWKTEFLARDAGDAAAAWFTALLERPARLNYLADPRTRAITGSYGQDGESVSAADSYPLLLTSTASLDQVNEWMQADRPDEDLPVLPMRRFRPNVVITGAAAFAEDEWATVRIGDVTFRAAGVCSRCVLTTTDPWTLARGKEPIRTLARHRGWGGKTWFGLNLIPTTTGMINIDDVVEVVAGDSPNRYSE